MTFKHTKSANELHEAFLRQVRHLRRSIAAYDQGDVEAAEVLAVNIYTLVFDGPSSKSAAKLAGVKQQLMIPDSRFPAETDLSSLRIGPPLCIIGPGGVYWHRNHGEPGSNIEKDIAKYPRIPFSKWWEQTVFTTNTGRTLNRRALVFAMRNQDGGGHLDQTIKDEAYRWLQAYGDTCIGRFENEDLEVQFILYIDPRYSAGGKVKIFTEVYLEAGTAHFAISDALPPPDAKPIRNAHWASMRQIAWELNFALTEAGY